MTGWVDWRLSIVKAALVVRQAGAIVIGEFYQFMQNGRMHLNIKNHEAHKLAQQLARATGKSMTEVVTEALRGELARAKHAPGMAQALMQISNESAHRFKPPHDTTDHAALLYDDQGLPR